MLNIRQFTKNIDLITLFDNTTFKNERDFIFTLELYNIAPRTEIIDILKSVYKREDIKQVHPTALRRNKQLFELEKKYKVILHEINKSSVIVYYDLFMDIQKDSLTLDLSCSNNILYEQIFHVPLTPHNFTIISNPKAINEDVYDYNFLLKILTIDCVEKGGTDLHFKTKHKNMKPYYTIEYRRDNYMWKNPFWNLNKSMLTRLIFFTIRDKTQANEQDIVLNGAEGGISDLLGDGKYELRVEAIPVLNGLNCVIRIQKLKTISLKISELGFDKEVQKGLEFLAKKTNGLTLITGPIRSGKNTTAFAMTNSMDLDKLSVLDISSPVEVLMNFPQVDYGGDVEKLLAILKRCKKLDLDVAILNEIPSKDVAFGVRDLVNSSVGVITTTHLDRAWHIGYKLKDYYGEDYKDILSQLNAIINQKMYVKQCPFCQETMLISQLPEEIEKYLKHYKVNTVKVSKGCSKCVNGKQPGGIQPYVEMIICTPDTKGYIRQYDKLSDLEDFLKNLLHTQKSSLDFKVSKAVESGILHYSEIYTLL